MNVDTDWSMMRAKKEEGNYNFLKKYDSFVLLHSYFKQFFHVNDDQLGGAL